MTAHIDLYTILPQAAKISFEVEDARNVSFASVGGGDGVPPGMQLKDQDEVLCWIAAQHFGVAVVRDERLISVEAQVGA